MRSSELMSRSATGLLVIDVQTKLVDKMASRNEIVANIARLVDGAGILGMATFATEQYPKGIGPTVPLFIMISPSWNR